MQDDFKMIAHDLGPRTVKVYAVADVHLGSPECNLEAFKEFLEEVRKQDDTYIVICGDVFDNAITGSVGGLYESTLPPNEAVDLAVELFAPIKDKILGVVSGNHEERSKRLVDYDPLFVVCSIIGIPQLYRHNAAFIRIKLGKPCSKLSDVYNLMIIHGKSESKLKKYEYSIEGIDAIISGHTHNGSTRKPARLVVTRAGNVVIKSLVSIVATSWLSYGGYGLRDLYLPNTSCDPQCLILEYTGTNSRAGTIKVAW